MTQTAFLINAFINFWRISYIVFCSYSSPLLQCLLDPPSPSFPPNFIFSTSRTHGESRLCVGQLCLGVRPPPNVIGVPDITQLKTLPRSNKMPAKPQLCFREGKAYRPRSALHAGLCLAWPCTSLLCVVCYMCIFPVESKRNCFFDVVHYL